MFKPYISDDKTLPELTIRACLLSIVITVLFTASNVYLGLKVGLTFASTIPAAVISMAILKVFKNSNILENTMVQTFASSAGTLSAIIFTLPALIIVGAWDGFPFWQTTLLCAIGGGFGVMYSIPLRRALVVNSDLPYPEGVAAAEVLKVGSKDLSKENLNIEESSSGMKDILLGGIISAVFSLLSAFRIFSSSTAITTKAFGSIFSIGINFSFALFGAGYLVGMRIALAMLLGLFVSWGLAVPILSHGQVMTGLNITSIANGIWSSDVRFIGVGAIGVAALWAIILLLSPVAEGLRSAFRAVSEKKQGIKDIPRTQKDIPINYVLGITLLLIIPLVAILYYFIHSQGLDMPNSMLIFLISLAVIFCLFVGFIVAAASGYMAGLVGSSSSPLSGIIILAVIIMSLIVTYIIIAFFPMDDFDNFKHFLIGFVIFTSSIVLASSAISNDNMQDLKTGHLVGATPWKQQTALLFGVIVGALTISPILDILYNAYGFIGALPRLGMDPTKALAAPQATLMAAIASGIIDHNIHWNMVEIGVVLGVVLILVDVFILKLKNLPRLSVLSVGIGIYLPAGITIMLVLGGIVSYLVKRKINKTTTQKNRLEMLLQKGTLVSAGLIVGESLIGVVVALVIGLTANQDILSLVSASFAPFANVLAVLVFLATVVFLYRYKTTSKE